MKTIEKIASDIKKINIKNNDWISVKDRLPTEEECEYNDLFEVTKKKIDRDWLIVDYCLFDFNHKAWFVRPNEEVIAWKFKSKAYEEGIIKCGTCINCKYRHDNTEYSQSIPHVCDTCICSDKWEYMKEDE